MAKQVGRFGISVDDTAGIVRIISAPVGGLDIEFDNTCFNMGT